MKSVYYYIGSVDNRFFGCKCQQALIIFAMILGLGTISYASCNQYAVFLQNNTDKIWQLHQLNCHHGRKAQADRFILPHQRAELVFEAADLITGWYGPDATFAYSNADEPHDYFAIRTQQNYCFMKAGDIHVDILHGREAVTHVKNNLGRYHLGLRQHGGRSYFDIG